MASVEQDARQMQEEARESLSRSSAELKQLIKHKVRTPPQLANRPLKQRAVAARLKACGRLSPSCECGVVFVLCQQMQVDQFTTISTIINDCETRSASNTHLHQF
jgi:hypothetical protein